jgi:hypothetical protein
MVGMTATTRTQSGNEHGFEERISKAGVSESAYLESQRGDVRIGGSRPEVEAITANRMSAKTRKRPRLVRVGETSVILDLARDARDVFALRLPPKLPPTDRARCTDGA